MHGSPRGIHVLPFTLYLPIFIYIDKDIDIYKDNASGIN